MSRVENLLIQWGGKSASLFGPTHLWNFLKITTLLVYLPLLFYLAPESTKGQEILKWIYEVVALPKIWTKKLEKFCPYTIWQNFSKYIHSEISWPLHNSLNTAKLVCYRPAMYQISLTILLVKSCNNHQLAAIAAQLTDWPEPNMEPRLQWMWWYPSCLDPHNEGNFFLDYNFHKVQILWEGYSIVKNSNADLTVGNWNSKKDP